MIRPPRPDDPTLFPLVLPMPCIECEFAASCHEVDTLFRCPAYWLGDPNGGALHPRHNEAKRRYNSVRGFGLEDVRVKRPTPALVPGLAPQVSRRIQVGVPPGSGAVTVKITDIVRNRQVVPKHDFLTALTLPRGTLAYVHWFEVDGILERLDGHGGALLDSLASAGYDGVTSASFSTYRNLAHFHARYSVKRSLLQFEQMSERGIPAIPHVAVNTPGDVADMRAFLLGNPTVKSVSVDLSNELKAGADPSLSLFEGLVASVDRPLHVLLKGAGIGSFDRVFRVLDPALTTVTNAKSLNTWIEGESDKSEVFRIDFHRQQLAYDLATAEAAASRVLRLNSGPVAPMAKPG